MAAAPEATPDEAAAPIQSLEIMTCNVNGVKSKKDYITHLEKDIYFIQETHLSKEEEREHLSNENYVTYHAHYTNPETDRSERGVAILIKKEIPFTFISEDRDSEGRYLIVRGWYGGGTLTLVNIYGPASRDDTESKTFFKNIFEKLKGSTNIIMGGDFNLVMDPVKDSAHTNTQRKPRSHTVVEEYMNNCDLCDIWRQKNPEGRDYTYTVASRYACTPVSRIDYFLISNSLRKHVTDCQILTIKISDHFPVLLKLLGSEAFLTELPPLREGGGAWISALVNLITGHTLTLGGIRSGLRGHFSGEEMLILEEELGTKEEPDHTPFHSYLEDLWDILREKYPTRITQVKWRKGESGEDYLQRVRTSWVQQSGTELNDQTMEQRYRRAVEAGCPKPVRNKLRETGGLSSMPLEEWEEHVCRHINEYNETQESQLNMNLENAGKQMNVERKVTTQEQTSSNVAVIGASRVEYRRCYECKNVGHIARYCPARPNRRARNSKYRGNRGRGWRGYDQSRYWAFWRQSEHRELLVAGRYHSTLN